MIICSLKRTSQILILENYMSFSKSSSLIDYQTIIGTGILKTETKQSLLELFSDVDR